MYFVFLSGSHYLTEKRSLHETAHLESFFNLMTIIIKVNWTSKHNNNKLRAVSLGFEGWYHSLSKNLACMLDWEETLFTFDCGICFCFPPAGANSMPLLQLAVVTRWLPSNGTVCAFHGRFPEGQKHHRGAEVRAPGSWHEHSWWFCWKTLLLPWQILWEQRHHFQDGELCVVN